MIVFHGTSACCYDSIIKNGLRKILRSYLRGRNRLRHGACVTTNITVAQTFALRHTPIDDFLCGEITGIIVEYELSGIDGRDYVAARDYRPAQDEAEVVVFETTMLRLTAVWRYHDAQWVREARN